MVSIKYVAVRNYNFLQYFLLLSLFLRIENADAQGSAISLDNQNIFYLGIPSPITVVVENMNTKNIILKIDNGELIQQEDPGKYLVSPEKAGIAIISIGDKKGREIAKYEYRVKRIPIGYPVFANKRIGFASKNELIAQIAVFVKLDGFDLILGLR